MISTIRVSGLGLFFYGTSGMYLRGERRHYIVFGALGRVVFRTYDASNADATQYTFDIFNIKNK